MPKLLNIFTKLAFFGFVICAPINWISIFNIGGLSIKYMHLAIIPIVPCILFKSFRLTVIKFIQKNAFIISSFMLLMIINFVSTCFNKTLYPNALSYIAKNLSYSCYFILFAVVMYFRVKQPSLYKEITYSNALSVTMFILTATIIFHALGRSFLGDMAGFFIKGDSISLRYDLFKILFNADSSGDSELAANLRNTLIGAFIYMHLTSLYASINVESRRLKYLNIGVILFSGFFVLASVSRSNILALVIGYFIYFVSEILINRNTKKLLQLIGVAVVALTLTLIFWNKIEDAFSNSTSMIAGRLSELEDDARWELDAEAINGFSNNFFIGKGSGATLSDGHSVHNFIIGSAYQAGVIGLILSVCFYFGVMFKMFTSLPTLSRYKGTLLVASLVAVPLLRSMESGNVGTLSLVEWFCLAIFFATIMVLKEKEGTSVQRYNL